MQRSSVISMLIFYFQKYCCIRARNNVISYNELTYTNSRLYTFYVLCVFAIGLFKWFVFFAVYLLITKMLLLFFFFVFLLSWFYFNFIFLNLYLFVLLMIFVCIAVAYCQNHISRMVHIEKINRVKCISPCPCFLLLLPFYFLFWLISSTIMFRFLNMNNNNYIKSEKHRKWVKCIYSFIHLFRIN